MNENVVHLHRAPVTSVQGTLALDLQPRFDPPEPASYGQHPVADVTPIEAPLRRGLEQWAGRYLQAAVEIVGGDRPVSQLLRWSSRDVYLDLERRAQLVARAGRHQPGQGRVQPVRPKVVGVHTCFLSRQVVTNLPTSSSDRAVCVTRERQWITPCSSISMVVGSRR